MTKQIRNLPNCPRGSGTIHLGHTRSPQRRTQNRAELGIPVIARPV